VTDARILTLAREVAEDLRNSVLEVSCEHRGVKYVPTVEVELTEQPLLTVAMAGIRITQDHRAGWVHQYDIDIGVQHRVAPNADAAMHFDKAMRLCEQIADKYRSTRPTLAAMVLVAAEYGGTSGLPYLAAHIDTLNQFTGVVRLTFQEWR